MIRTTDCECKTASSDGRTRGGFRPAAHDDGTDIVRSAIGLGNLAATLSHILMVISRRAAQAAGAAALLSARPFRSQYPFIAGFENVLPAIGFAAA
jgi:hypothetical protein